MRLWTVHPRYLDSVGLVALWREALLARQVLLNRTRGYRHHPQLRRFREQSNPVACINSYLAFVHDEATRRGYRFDRSKVGRARASGALPETTGQLGYEWRHLMKKLDRRSPEVAKRLVSVRRPEANPLFRIVRGDVRSWEKNHDGDA
jgi:Pyrimidine dimer DNA glycosylase